MANFEKGSIEELRFAVGMITDSCKALDVQETVNWRYTERIMDALHMLCVSHLAEYPNFKDARRYFREQAGYPKELIDKD